jgi:B3/4 domain
MEIAPELRSAFPGLRVVKLKLTGLTVRSSDPDLESFKLEVQERVRRRTASLEEVKDQPIFRAYRDFFWRVGIDPTKTRPAGEALTRRILGGRDLPRINTVVDAYNLVSVETSIAIAAFDSMKVRARLGPYFAAISPAGSWKAATLRTKVAVTRPSPETFWWRSAAIREKTEETLYQFMAETTWTVMRVVTAFRFSRLLNKRTLQLLTPTGFDYNDWSTASTIIACASLCETLSMAMGGEKVMVRWSLQQGLVVIQVRPPQKDQGAWLRKMIGFALRHV